MVQCMKPLDKHCPVAFSLALHFLSNFILNINSFYPDKEASDCRFVKRDNLTHLFWGLVIWICITKPYCNKSGLKNAEDISNELKRSNKHVHRNKYLKTNKGTPLIEEILKYLQWFFSHENIN